MGKVIGIDLGTTHSAVSVIEGGDAEIIPNAEGNRTTPSVVSFNKDGELLVGELAKRQSVVNPENTIFSVKRFMGRTFTETEQEAERAPYHIVKGENDKALIKVPHADKTFSPEEMSAFILQKLKKDAESYLGEKVTEAVITVPAYFNDSQRQATKDAGKIAGLDVKRIVNEPTAASLAYGLEKEEGQTILVFDLGGGTFDVSILEFGDGVFEVKATAGDNHLGGDDFDELIMNWIADEFQKENDIDLRKDRTALQRLKEAAEKAKKELSTVAKTNINLPYVTVTDEGPKHVDLDLTRSKFEDLMRPLIERCKGPTQQALKDANLQPDDIDEVLLVGGSTRIPAVQQVVKDVVGKEPNKSVNPDEAVSLGAAVQAGVLTGEVTDLLLLDVTPLSLGIETLGGVFTKLIERNTTIPSKKGKVFSTAADNQTSVEIHVLQGERAMAADNKSLGRFMLSGIPPAPRGVPQIEVTFDIDANGILNVTAQDKGTGKEQKITISGSTRLDENEVERMQTEAEKYEEEDKKRVELINAKNELDGLVSNATRTLEEAEDKVDDDVKERVNAALDEAKQALEGDDADEIKKQTEKLGKVMQEIGMAIYQQAAGAAPGADAAGAAGMGADPMGGMGGAADADADPETATKQGEGPDGIDVEYDVNDKDDADKQ